MSALNEQIVQAIASQGFYVGRSIFDAALILALSARMQELGPTPLLEQSDHSHETALSQPNHRDLQLRPARVGRGAQAALAPDIRGDSIAWIDQAHNNAAETSALLAVDGLRVALNAGLFLGLVDSEFHYAHYAKGARYHKHIDRFGDRDLRVISLVFYLNAHWQPCHGGELVIYNQAQDHIARVLPQRGTMVVFLSEVFPHEVLPATRARCALTGWLRRRALAGPDTFN